MKLAFLAALVQVNLSACNTKPTEIDFKNPLALQRADFWVFKAEDGT